MKFIAQEKNQWYTFCTGMRLLSYRYFINDFNKAEICIIISFAKQVFETSIENGLVCITVVWYQ